MSEILTVNQALGTLSELAETDIRVRGILHYQFEDIAIYHSPSIERKPGYGSSIWISVGMGALQFDEHVCRALDGKMVIVEGKIFSPDPTFGGCGHMGLWPAEMLVRTLEGA
jgi:hypothetical protein